MRFSLKLVFSVMSIVCLLFTISGILFVKQNFDHSLSVAADQNDDQHILQKYALESNMLGYLVNGESYSDEKLAGYASRLTGYAGGVQKFLGIFAGEREIYSNLPLFSTEKLTQAVDQSEWLGFTEKVDDKTYMLFATGLDVQGTSATVITAYDISELFVERNRQSRSFLMLTVILILASGLMIGFLAWLLTRPIVRLNRASNKIATGSYDERTKVKSNDEIGELSKSFDKMAEAVSENVESLKLSIQQRDDFIAAFSHEMKTPMTSIIGFADILRTGTVNSEKQFKYAKIIYGDAKRLEALSLKLLDLMGISDNKTTSLPLSTEKLMDGVKKQAQDFLEEIELLVDFEPATVLGDDVLLQCLLGNLITNAKKATPNDHCVRISGIIDGVKYRFTVTDKGTGIPKDQIKRIIEPFYMVDKSRARTAGGSGLGLFLCEKIATLHGSELVFESEPGVGTSVSFELSMIEGGEA